MVGWQDEHGIRSPARGRREPVGTGGTGGVVDLFRWQHSRGGVVEDLASHARGINGHWLVNSSKFWSELGWCKRPVWFIVGPHCSNGQAQNQPQLFVFQYFN
jgi:hypothetical protein